MDVIGDLVARERRSDDLAVEVASRSGSYSYEKCCTSAWKSGNLLRHYGVRSDATVAIDAGDSPSPPPVVAFLGAALLGATARYVESDTEIPEGTRAALVPEDRAADYDPEPGVQVLAYGGPVDDPRVAHFEREVWSENPTMPPDEVDPESAALATADREFTQARLLDAAESVVADYRLDADDRVVLRSPLTEPGTVAAGILAPLWAGGTVTLDPEATGTIAVSSDECPEERRIDPGEVV